MRPPGIRSITSSTYFCSPPIIIKTVVIKMEKFSDSVQKRISPIVFEARPTRAVTTDAPGGTSRTHRRPFSRVGCSLGGSLRYPPTPHSSRIPPGRQAVEPGLTICSLSGQTHSDHRKMPRRQVIMRCVVDGLAGRVAISPVWLIENTIQVRYLEATQPAREMPERQHTRAASPPQQTG